MKTVGNAYTSIVTRQLCQRVKPLPNIWEDMVPWTLNIFNHLYPNWEYQCVSFDTWNNRDNFTGKRKREQLRARQSLDSVCLYSKDHFRKLFVKMELMNLKEPKEPRAISGCSDRSNAYFGPMIYGYSKALSKSWSLDHWMCYTSGKTSENISDWLANQCARLKLDPSNWIFVCADESRQDAHVSYESKTWEHTLMLRKGLPDWFVSALSETRKTTGHSDGLFYSRKGGRDTGTGETSSANSDMNGIKTCKTFDTWTSIDWSNPPFACLVQGDDTLVLTHRNLIPEPEKFAEHVTNVSKDLGFVVRFVNISTNIWDVDYCSRYFWPTPNHDFGYVLAPKIGKVLGKAGWSRQRVHNLRNHSYGIALGLQIAVSNVPFLKEWIARLLSLTEKDSTYTYQHDHSIKSVTEHCYTDETWDFLWYKYNLTQLDLLVFEQNLQGVKSLPYSVQFPGNLDRIVDIDTE